MVLVSSIIMICKSVFDLLFPAEILTLLLEDKDGMSLQGA